MKRVEVTWVDPEARFHDWTERDSITPDDLAPRECRSVGYLFHETADYIVLVASDGGHEIGDGLSLPRGCILSITELAPAAPSLSEVA